MQLTILALPALMAALTAAVLPPAGNYAGYFDTECALFDANNFPIINTCHPLPDNSIIVSSQASGTFNIYTDDNCQDGVQTVAVETCTDTSAFRSLKVDCC